MLEKDAGILILDPCFEKGLTNTLRQILETSFDTEIRITNVAYADGRESMWKDQVFAAISSFLPELIFVLLPSGYIGRLKNMIRFIKSEFSNQK